jgi:rhodanese-related sulfurtransferase
MLHKKIFFIFLVLLIFPGTAIVSAASVSKITAEELHLKLNDPELIIIDVRLERDWESSTLKIKGAVWEDFQEVNSWAEKYSRDRTIILYCD